MSETANSGAPTKLWNKNFIMVILLGLFTNGSSQMVTTLITKYAVQLGAELTLAATISATLSIVALCCRPFSGLVADKFNRKHIMMISVAITAACVMCYGLFPSVSALFAFRIIHGAAFAFMGVANMAFGTSFIPDDRIGEGIAYLSLGSVLASAVGPSIGLSLSNKYGFDAVFRIVSCILVLAFVLISLIPYKKPVRSGIGARVFSIRNLIEPRVIFLAMILMLFSSGNGLMNTYAQLLGDERGIANIGFFFTAYSISTFICRPFVGKLLDKKGLTFIMIPSIILAGCAMGCISVANATWWVILAGILKAAGQGSATASVNGSAIKKLGRERAGVISSTCYIGQDIGNAFAPIIGSYIVERSGYGTLFGAYSIILVIFGLSFYALYLYTEKKTEERKAEKESLV